jgi:hypothetical protein
LETIAFKANNLKTYVLPVGVLVRLQVNLL